MKKTISKIQNNRETLDLKEFMLLDAKKQAKKIEEILKKLYEDTLEVDKNHVEKVLDVCFEPKDKEIYLPYNLEVAKKDNEVIFEFKKKRNIWLLLFMLFGFLLGIAAATYVGILLLRESQLNIDINDDGIPELNLDLDKDRNCDVNCDTTGNNKPNTNIDYANSRKAIFNVIKEGNKIFNAVNQDLDNDGVCDLNCDTDDDGWPDANLDLDGDGTPDLNIDNDNDGKCDLNCDLKPIDGNCDLNCDTDGDGNCDLNCDNSGNDKCDLNCDLNGDGECQLNCDTNGDGIPDKNIDYKNNEEPTFNTPANPTNQDNNHDGICDLNCDVDGDGHPDTNIDLDGDGKADVDIDKNNDGVPDINLDSDGNGVCDLNCDTDGDGKCDLYCIEVGVITNGGSLVTGDNTMDINTASLIVIFERESAISSFGLYPDDQPGDVNKTIPDIVFSVENYSEQTLTYNIKWLIAQNTFTSDNMWYKVVGTNGGYNHDWQSLPKQDAYIAQNVTIAPGVKQIYTVSMTLHGIGAVQNYDQGRRINAKVFVESIY